MALFSASASSIHLTAESAESATALAAEEALEPQAHVPGDATDLDGLAVAVVQLPAEERDHQDAGDGGEAAHRLVDGSEGAHAEELGEDGGREAPVAAKGEPPEHRHDEGVSSSSRVRRGRGSDDEVFLPQTIVDAILKSSTTSPPHVTQQPPLPPRRLCNQDQGDACLCRTGRPCAGRKVSKC